MPLIQQGTDIWTYKDAVEYVLDTHEVGRTGLNERRARWAVRKAYNDLATKYDWSYFYRQRLLQTSASYSTGTVDFDYTGGTNELQLTLASGTWPTWAAFGRVIISNVHYEVDRRISDSVLTLRSDSNPGEDVASGATYEIYRSAYPLPTDFWKLNRVWDTTDSRALTHVDSVAHHDALNIFYDTPDTPWQFTIRNTREYYGGLSIVLGPPPGDARTYDILYQAFPRPLNIDEYNSGTVAVTASSAAITGSSTTFPTNCEGSVIRIGSGATSPTGLLGGLDGKDDPFAQQGVIKTYTSATALTAEDTFSTAASGAGFVISDPIDLEPGSMLTAFLHAAEAEFSRLAGREDWRGKTELARQSLLSAMEADNGRVENLARRFVYDPFKHGTESTASG
jgi:hypothetical protein